MNGVPFASTGVVALGVSTPFVYWGFELVRDIVEAIAGRTVWLHIASLEQLREGFLRRDSASVVVTCDLPDPDFAEFVCASGLPLIVFSDDPEAFLDWAMRSRSMGAVEAARFCTRMYSALAPNLRAERKLVVAARDDATPERIAADVIEFLWPGRGEWLVHGVVQHLVEAGKLTREWPRKLHDRSEWPDRLEGAAPDAESWRTLCAAVASYVGLTEGQWPQQIVWPLALFHRPDGRPWRAPIDLTGPARVVLYGPYLHLPVGQWTARVEFEIDGAVSGVEASTDVVVNEVVTEKTFEMPAKGIFAYELSFRVENPHQWVEIRLFIKKSAIEGVFLPRSVGVRPAPRETVEPARQLSSAPP